MSSKIKAPQSQNFFKRHILPVLFIFLIPGFSVWFFSYAENDLDQTLLGQIEATLRSNPQKSQKEDAHTLRFYQTVPISRIMASNKPEAAQLQAVFEDVKFRYAVFRWMKRVAWLCLATIAATLLVVGLSVAFSMRSHAAQYYALRIGWPVLRTSAAIQVIGQGALAIALSFWVTAILTHTYWVKLIAIAACFALSAMISLWKAIFAKVDNKCEVFGEIVTEERAPILWSRVRETAARLNTVAPDLIFAGADQTFFVTENPVLANGQIHHGRILYLSLPMLRVLSTDEANSVLGHELAHFSGQDTFWSRKISPLQVRFALYIQMLGHGLSAFVAHFMLMFWKLYSLSLSKLSRAREFRADQVGAECASNEAMKRALVKVTSYCDYRFKQESKILKQERIDKNLDLAAAIGNGYPAYLSTFVAGNQSLKEVVSHPFDSHPTLEKRLTNLGFEAHQALSDVTVPPTLHDTWFADISEAAALEERLWSERQQRLQSVHSQTLAWRLLPKNDEEAAIVQEHFPEVVFRDKKGAEAILRYDGIQMPAWDRPILFKDIVSAKLESGIPHKRLRLLHHKDDKPKPVSTKCYPAAFKADRGDLLAVFGLYLSRHKTAEAKSTQAQNESAEAAAT